MIRVSEFVVVYVTMLCVSTRCVSASMINCDIV